MAAAAVPAARAGVSLAERGGQAVAKALTADIVVVNGKFYRELKTREPTGKLTKAGRPQMRTVRRLEPTDVDLHINPVSVAIGGSIALLAGGLALWWMGLGVARSSEKDLSAIQNQIDVLQTEIDALKYELKQRQAGTWMGSEGCIYTEVIHGIDENGHPYVRENRYDVCAELKKEIAADEKRQKALQAQLDRLKLHPFHIVERARFSLPGVNIGLPFP